MKARRTALAFAAGALAIQAVLDASLLPQVPTFAELGYFEIDFSNWIGVAAMVRADFERNARIVSAFDIRFE